MNSRQALSASVHTLPVSAFLSGRQKTVLNPKATMADAAALSAPTTVEVDVVSDPN
jgi:hypothetical protein